VSGNLFYIHTQQMQTGNIKFYNAPKGFGFITTSEGRDLFFHVTKIAGYQPGMQVSFNDGDAVTFEEVEGKKGPEAIDVAKASGGAHADMEMVD